MVKPRPKKQDASPADEGMPDAVALGEKLRQRREQMGLSLEQVFDKTKLRPSLVEAIEQERWEDLPAPAFVKGFLRTYAKLLDLDDREIISLYEARVPRDTRPFEFILTKRKQRKTGWVAGTLIVIAIVGVTYWWIQQPPPGVSTGKRAGVKPIESQKQVLDQEEKPKPAEATPQTSKQEVVSSDQKATEAVVADAENTSVGPDNSPIDTQATSEAQEATPPEPTANFVLKGVVKERTWMRVTTDERQSREYIFDPGSKPVWKAQRVFDIMIGNAAGIDLELNGKPLGPLGKRGKVVHLILPKES